jgi:hypothetical protein
MKTNIYLLSILSLIFIISCKDDDPVTPGGTAVLGCTDSSSSNYNPDATEDDGSCTTDTGVFYQLPDLNSGPITFEEVAGVVYGPSADADGNLDEAYEFAKDSPTGHWGNFGGFYEEDDKTVKAGKGGSPETSYVDNPDQTGNDSNTVLRIVKKGNSEKWSGIYFDFENKFDFPAGKEAISFDYWVPADEAHLDLVVKIKLETNKFQDDDDFISTGEVKATARANAGWNTLIFNIDAAGTGWDTRQGSFNRFVLLASANVSNTEDVTYYLDNINFSVPGEIVLPSAPTDAPSDPTYAKDEVISIYSDEYDAISGVNYNPNWGQGTVQTEVEIAENNVLKYENLNYQGTTFDVTDFSAKTKLHVDFFTGNATSLDIFLINSDVVTGSEAKQKAYSFDVTTSAGQWNSVDIDLSHFSDIVDLDVIDQIKIEGDGTVYLDNIYFFGGGDNPGTNYSPAYTEGFNGATVSEGVYEFPTAGSETWAGFANKNAVIYPLSFPNGGKITFNAATSGTDIVVYFKFEKEPYPNVDPAFSTSQLTISGTDTTEYTVVIAPQDDKTFSSALFYLVTQDQALTASDFVITSYD